MNIYILWEYLEADVEIDVSIAKPRHFIVESRKQMERCEVCERAKNSLTVEVCVALLCAYNLICPIFITGTNSSIDISRHRAASARSATLYMSCNIQLLHWALSKVLKFDLTLKGGK